MLARHNIRPIWGLLSQIAAVRIKSQVTDPIGYMIKLICSHLILKIFKYFSNLIKTFEWINKFYWCKIGWISLVNRQRRLSRINCGRGRGVNPIGIQIQVIIGYELVSDRVGHRAIARSRLREMTIGRRDLRRWIAMIHWINVGVKAPRLLLLLLLLD